MLEPDKWQSKAEVITAFENNSPEFPVVMALAKVGWAFCEIHAFENLVKGLILATTSVDVGRPDKYASLDAGGKILLKHEKLSKSMLGQMSGHLKTAGFSTRNSWYLEKLVHIRNDFIHRFSNQVPLPGDWEKRGFDAEMFSQYPQQVGKRFELASRFFPTMMISSGFLNAEKMPDGILLFDPDTWPRI